MSVITIAVWEFQFLIYGKFHILKKIFRFVMTSLKCEISHGTDIFEKKNPFFKNIFQKFPAVAVHVAGCQRARLVGSLRAPALQQLAKRAVKEMGSPGSLAASQAGCRGAREAGSSGKQAGRLATN